MAKSPSKSGTIDLPALFEAAAQRLLLSVRQGRLLHKTKNIRDAGLPLEVEFRSFLGSRLPAPFTVSSGYLFDPRSVCTPQIDAIVVDGTESHELMRSDDGAAYVPYPSGRTLFEIKNSTRGLGAHVAQVKIVGAAIDKMRADAATLRGNSGAPFVERPLSVLVVGDSEGAKLSQFKKIYTSRLIDPALTILLDRGVIIGRRGAMEEFFVYSERDGVNVPFALDFLSFRSSGEWAIWEPEVKDNKSGRALLWLYFSIVAQLNWAVRGNQGTIRDFTNQVARDFPMILKTTLSAATKW
jgi:hypothetical protein